MQCLQSVYRWRICCRLQSRTSVSLNIPLTSVVCVFRRLKLYGPPGSVVNKFPAGATSLRITEQLHATSLPSETTQGLSYCLMYVNEAISRSHTCYATHDSHLKVVRPGQVRMAVPTPQSSLSPKAQSSYRPAGQQQTNLSICKLT